MNPYIASLVGAHYGLFLSILKELIAINTVFNNAGGIRKALARVEQVFRQHIPSFNVLYDEAGNLVCFTDSIDTASDILYLSAHIDTVPARQSEWSEPFKPFIPSEDVAAIVGRGS